MLNKHMPAKTLNGNPQLPWLKPQLKKLIKNSEDYLISENTRTRSAIINSAKFRTIFAKSNVYKNSFFPRTIPAWNQTTDTDVAEIVAYCSSTSLD